MVNLSLLLVLCVIQIRISWRLLSSYCSYDFIGKIKEFNGSRQSSNGKLTYKDVEELYVSPSVKRSIWQTLTILEEIKKIMGCEPKRIFIEMARSKEESKRTDSRLKKLQDLYKKCREENIDFMHRKDEFNALKTQLSSKKERIYAVISCIFTIRRWDAACIRAKE